MNEGTMTETLTTMEAGVRKEKSLFVRPAFVLAILLAASVGLNIFLGWRMSRLSSVADAASRQSQLEVGGFVPSITGRAIDGRRVVVSYGERDLPTILYFFSPGCETCERNIQNIKKLVDTKKGEYNIVGVSLVEDGLSDYITKHDINFPVYSGIGVETTLAYKLGRVPQTTVVLPNGKVVANWHGPFDGKLRSTIETYFEISF
jgi:peroxiredoxin